MCEAIKGHMAFTFVHFRHSPYVTVDSIDFDFRIRGEIREKKGIPDEGGCAKVVCVYTYCCAVCSYCQEAQEMDSFHASMAVEGAAMDRQ